MRRWRKAKIGDLFKPFIFAIQSTWWGELSPCFRSVLKLSIRDTNTLMYMGNSMFFQVTVELNGACINISCFKVIYSNVVKNFPGGVCRNLQIAEEDARKLLIKEFRITVKHSCRFHNIYNFTVCEDGENTVR